MPLFGDLWWVVRWFGFFFPLFLRLKIASLED